MESEVAKRLLQAFRKESLRHVLVLEADMPEDYKRNVFSISNRLRLAGNELVAIMRNNLAQLVRTKRYRKLKALYGKAAENDDSATKAHITTQMKAMQEDYNVSWDYCRKAMIPIGKKYDLPSVFALTRAEDIWKGVEKILYEDGKMLRFSRKGDLPILRAKQIERAITVKNIAGHLVLSCGSMTFSPIVADRFQKDEVAAILHYLSDHDAVDDAAARTFGESGSLTDTFRPCYASLKCEIIRGRLRVFIHLTVEGKAKPKFNRDGTPRHSYGVGPVGGDIGTQTIAYTSASECGLRNLAERGTAIAKSERIERIIQRRLDRSRRANNPDNFNEDGTIKKGPKKWKCSKNYLKDKQRLAELMRKNAINRHLSIREDVNHIRSLGDVFITEVKNAKRLMKRAKETTVNEKTGKTNRKKRYGKSIHNRCPGYYQSYAKLVFTSTGGRYIEVPPNYRASQYDHTNGEYVKRKLSARMFPLSDGTVVQRDLYSSFLLFNAIEDSGGTIVLDRTKCVLGFEEVNRMHSAEIERIRASGKRVMNSGIRV